METSNVIIAGVLAGVVGYLGWKMYDNMTPVVSSVPASSLAPTGSPTLSPMVTTTAPVTSTNVAVSNAVVQATQAALSESSIDYSGTIVNGKFPDNSFANVAFAAGDGPTNLAGNTLLTVAHWNNQRASYSSQHGNCCPEQLPDRPGLFTSAQYRAMLGK